MALTREIQMLKEQHREAEVQNVIDALNMEVNVLRSQQDEQDEMAVKLMELQALQQSVFQEHIHSQQTAAAKQNLIDEQQRAYLAKLIAYQRSLHGTLQQGGIAPKPPQEPLSSEPIQTQPTPSPKRRTKKASPRKRKEAPSSIPETPISQELSRSEDADEEELAAISVLKQLSLERYAMCFSRNHITEAMLRDLTDAEMEEIGVAPLGHRLLIRKWQDKLRKKEREKSVGTTTSSIAPTSPGVTRTRANSSLPRIPNISLGRLPTTEKLTTTSVAAREQSANASYKELQQFQEHLAQHVASVSAKTDKTDETLPKKDSGGSSRRRYPTIEELEKRYVKWGVGKFRQIVKICKYIFLQNGGHRKGCCEEAAREVEHTTADPAAAGADPAAAGTADAAAATTPVRAVADCTIEAAVRLTQRTSPPRTPHAPLTP